MEEEFENNDSSVNNFQEDMKNSQDYFKQESMNNIEEENELDDDTFQYIANIREIAKRDFSKYITKQTASHKSKNNFINNLNFKYTNDNDLTESTKKQENQENQENINLNEDISGISLLKELEDQWNNIEKQKNININKNNKNDESTYSNSKSNNNIDKLKYVVDMIELKKNKFIKNREKAKKERNDDNEIEQYFMQKLKEMDKYKITDEDLKKKIEIRQQEKENEDNYDENNENDNQNDNYEENNDYDENNNYEENKNYEENNNFANENTFNKNQYLQRKENYNLQNTNKSPELEDLVHETPARINNLDKNIISLENNINKNEYENENEDNVNIGNLTRPEKTIMSGKLFDKMKNLYQEINGDNNNKEILNNKNKSKQNSFESGVLGINNLNLKEKTSEENIILKNIRNNKNENGNINDANKSINLNFNYININEQKSNNKNMKNFEQNKIFKNNDILNNFSNQTTANKINYNNIFKDKDRMTLSGLQENFEDILKKVKSSHTVNNDRNNKINFNFFKDRINYEDDDEKEEFDKYFEDLSNEAKLNLQKNKNITESNIKSKYKKENKILKKFEELNNFVDEMSQNKNRNKFQQKLIEINSNLNNIINKEDINNSSFQQNQYFGYQNINNLNKYKRDFSGYNIFSNNNNFY